MGQARPAKDSALAHKYLDGLKGLEVGGGAHNPFGLDTWNLDFTASLETIWKKAEIDAVGRAMPVDIVGLGEALPLVDGCLDFVISSHVLEHIADPIEALTEWFRVIRPGGYIFLIIPHKERTFDKPRPRTKLVDLIDRHQSGVFETDPPHNHYSVWITEDVVELIKYLGWPVVEVQERDDKVGNGFTVVVRKPVAALEKPNMFEVLACPVCKVKVEIEGAVVKNLRCTHCGRCYRIDDGVPILLATEAMRTS